LNSASLAIDPTNYTIAVNLAKAAMRWRRKRSGTIGPRKRDNDFSRPPVSTCSTARETDPFERDRGFESLSSASHSRVRSLLRAMLVALALVSSIPAMAADDPLAEATALSQ
jgi:hypothetical protein